MIEKKKVEKTPKDFETMIRERVESRPASLRQMAIDEPQSTPKSDFLNYLKIRLFGKKVVIPNTNDACDFKLALDKHQINYVVEAKVGQGWIFRLGEQEK